MLPTPRLLIAGLSGDSGKTIVSIGLLLSLRRAGIPVRAFKKGPDYIDAAWLAWASGHPARNLDVHLMGPDTVVERFLSCAVSDGVNVIEGNRGLFDGFDIRGSHSSAALAELLRVPVVLVVDATKMTRTAAALVLGCQTLDPGISIRGVVLNNISGSRHERIARGAIESSCSVPVIGALPRLADCPIPERHLGLVPPQEHSGMDGVAAAVLKLVENTLDLDAFLSIARAASPLDLPHHVPRPSLPDANGLRIGVLRDAAFSFYYPENLEALERAGAQIVPISSLEAASLPTDLHALYIGGGFPETHGRRLSANKEFLKSLLKASREGLPIYAECGGLMLLARSLSWNSERYEMAGVLPVDVEVFATPQGHGYCELNVDTPNPFLPLGASLRGHEFHYSRIVNDPGKLETACATTRGVGCGSGRDFIVSGNVMAGYTHLHAAASPEWAEGILRAALKFQSQGSLLRS
ncbi:MAG TPA: cobyrinate a,c-diamide synthase [Terracidiphilus sp.]|nr:cobyrinate a,c-diamide synthase [Terracidiphilus sp.]